MLEGFRAFLSDIPDHVQGGVIGAALAVLAFLAPRIWDLYKKRFEQWAQRSPLEREVPEPNDRQLLALLREELRRDLDDLDEGSRWEHRRFVPLDAEVNVIRGDRVRRRVTDLLTAIRKFRRDRLFLVIGDPGSGKSVALRKLCRELLDRSSRANRLLPLYINLREWSPETPWSKDNPPTEQDFRAFILHNVKQRVSASLHNFLDHWLLELLGRGRLFLILDSFDEIPAVMDSHERSELVLQLSDVIARTARSGGTGRTVLASRPFRRPRFSLEDTGRRPNARRNMPVFELRPFSDIKIAKAIDQAAKDPLRPLSNPAAVKHALFHDRPDLSSIVRTPFMLGLTIDYWEAHPGEMPSTQAELYESFIERSLRLAESVMRQHALDKGAVHTCAAAIAREMFESEDYGLDIPVTELCRRLPDLPVLPTVTALRRAQIARPSESDTFSFIHRRFHEYFLIDHFEANPDNIPLEAISGDTRWREGLALFCEVSDEEVAKRIADYCWQQIRHARDVGAAAGSELYRQALHSLRFLGTAYRARRSAIKGIELDLATQIKSDLTGDDILKAKHAIEASAALSPSNAQQVLTGSLSSGYPWLMDVAFHASRYLPKITTENQILLIKNLLDIPITKHFWSYREISFLLGSMESLSLAKRFYQVRHIEILLALPAMTVWLFSSTNFLVMTAIGYLGLGPFAWLIGLLDDVVDQKNKRKTFRPDPVGALLLVTGVPMLLVLTLAACFSLLELAPENGAPSTVSESLLDFWHASFEWAAPLPYEASFILLMCSVLLIRPITSLSWISIKVFQMWRRLLEKYRQGAWEFAKALLKGITPFVVSFVGYLLFASFFVLFGKEGPLSELGAFQLAAGLPLVAAVPLAVITIGLIGFVFATARAVYAYSTDIFTLQKAKATAWTRPDIARSLGRFRTPAHRLRYIRWLASSGCEAPREAWPDGERPWWIGDAASSQLLAQLDERWLGLDQ